MKKSFTLIIAVTLLVTGCSEPKSIRADDFNALYANLADKSDSFMKSLENADNQEFLKLVKEDYEDTAVELEKISISFARLAKDLNSEASKSFAASARLILDLRNDFLEESKYLETLIPTCPLTWDNSKLQEIEDCGRANLRWSPSSDRALVCTYYFVAREFENIPEFDSSKVSLFSDYSYSDKDLKSCGLFKNSNSLYGYPKKVGTTWIPERFQTKFLRADQMFVVEIAENLYTASEGEGNLLSDALYGSWNGSCAVYARYESRLREAGYLLGSIKNGTCF